MTWMSAELPGEEPEVSGSEAVYRIKRRWRGFGLLTFLLGLAWSALAISLDEPLDNLALILGFAIFSLLALWGFSLQTEKLLVGSDGIRYRILGYERFLSWTEIESVTFKLAANSTKLKGAVRSFSFDSRFVRHNDLREEILRRTERPLLHA